MRIHLLMIANTDDPSVGESVAQDAREVIAWMEDVSRYTALPLAKVIIKGHAFTKKRVKAAVSAVAPAADDAVVFWYAGHGFRTPDKEEQWPYIAFESEPYGITGLDEYEVFSTLKEKRPRLLLLFCDCCNSVMDTEVETKLEFRSKADQGVIEDNYRRLFVESRGTLLAASSQPGEYSLGGSEGGWFTAAFLDAVRDIVERKQASWEGIMKRAAEPMPTDENPTGYQTPIYELDVGKSTSSGIRRLHSQAVVGPATAASQALRKLGLPGFAVADYRHLLRKPELQRLQQHGIRTMEHLAALARTEKGLSAVETLLAVREGNRRDRIRRALRSSPRVFVLRDFKPRGMGCVAEPPARARADDGGDAIYRELVKRTFPTQADVRDLALRTRVRDQGQRGTCVAFATTKAFETLRANGDQRSPQYLYWQCKQNDGIPDTSGTYPQVAVRMLRDSGCCSETTMSYQPESCTPESGAAPSDKAHAEARENVTTGGVFVPYGRHKPCPSVLFAKAAVSGGTGLSPRAVVGAFRLFESFNNDYTSSTGQVNMPLPGEPEIGGHAMAVVGYQDDNSWPGGGYLLVLNSWGEGWAYKSPDGPGICRIPYEYMARYGIGAGVILGTNDHDEVFTRQARSAAPEAASVPAAPRQAAKPAKGRTNKFLRSLSRGKLPRMVREIEKWLDWVEKASPGKLGDEVADLRRHRTLWELIPGGNRDYMQRALDARRENPETAKGLLNGLRPHLLSAWPHIVASIVSQDPSRNIKGDEVHGAMDAAADEVRELKPAQLAELMRQLIADRLAQEAVAPGNHLQTLQLMLGKYDRLKGSDAEKYIREKRKSIGNLVGKVVIPAIVRHLSRKGKTK